MPSVGLAPPVSRPAVEPDSALLRLLLAVVGQHRALGGLTISLGYYQSETLARQFGNNLGLAMVRSGLARWWTPWDVWRAAISKSIRWDD